MFGLSQNGINVPKVARKSTSLVTAEMPSARAIASSGAIASEHSIHSSLREKLIEHLFVGELLRSLWRAGHRDIEVLKSEVDAGGYDLAIECNGRLRHIQLKASSLNAKTSEVGINTRLSIKPSGCVIWICFDPETLGLGPFLWFGGAPGATLPDLGTRVARHSRANSQGEKAHRPGIRLLKRTAFTPLNRIEELAEQLFGVCAHSRA